MSSLKNKTNLILFISLLLTIASFTTYIITSNSNNSKQNISQEIKKDEIKEKLKKTRLLCQEIENKYNLGKKHFEEMRKDFVEMNEKRKQEGIKPFDPVDVLFERTFFIDYKCEKVENKIINQEKILIDDFLIKTKIERYTQDCIDGLKTKDLKYRKEKGITNDEKYCKDRTQEGIKKSTVGLKEALIKLNL